MPRVSGTYSLPPSYRATSGQTIRTEQHNPPLEDIAVALTGSVPRDGSAPMTGNLPMNGLRITNMGAATQASDAVRRDQVTLYSAYLSSVAGLALEANQLVYATGAGIAGKTVLTAFARTLLDDADAGAARTTLGLGTAATREAEDTLTNGSNLPDGAAVKSYVDGQDIGVSQSWQSPARSVGVSYRNTTGKPIQVIIEGASGGLVQASTNASSWVTLGVMGSPGNYEMSIAAIIPDDHYYRATSTFTRWLELR